MRRGELLPCRRLTLLRHGLLLPQLRELRLQAADRRLERSSVRRPRTLLSRSGNLGAQLPDGLRAADDAPVVDGPPRRLDDCPAGQVDF